MLLPKFLCRIFHCSKKKIRPISGKCMSTLSMHPPKNLQVDELMRYNMVCKCDLVCTQWKCVECRHVHSDEHGIPF